ncbi:aldo/keto reductase [Alphaproteobacteria bacterium KMM 3653]|uniref:Aldo/keto reductase n=1 Tax=Harenicola maris TaxID=2841044 RepID=A0AAP2CMS5_9RHOB|nr:aldo/keto reductase [Harenicola maris]
MERVTLGNDMALSRIVYGMWRLGDDADTSPAHVQAKIEACLEQGITSFDQADIYGDYGAEEILGNCLRGNTALRNQMEIVTKCDIVAPCGRYADARVKYYDTSRAHIAASVEHSLRLMAIEQIDLLLIHRPDPFMDHHETGAALDEMVASGKVRHVGVSNFKLHDWTLLQSGMKSPLVTNQIELSLTAHEGFTNGDVAYLQERGIKPMAWSPLGGGGLMTGDAGSPALHAAMDALASASGTDRAAVAVAWLLAHPAGLIPVMGTNNLSRIKGFSDALKVPMDRQTWYELYTHALGNEVP